MLLAIIEKAESSSAAIIADFGDNRLPSIRNTFESLSNSKAHVRPRYGDSLMAFSILSQFFETNAGRASLHRVPSDLDRGSVKSSPSVETSGEFA